MIISFDRSKVQALIASVHPPGELRFSRNPLDSHAVRMGLRLVGGGGKGVYLEPDVPDDLLEGEKSKVYAYEANPRIMESDAYLLAVERVFGTADGGVEHLSPEVVNQWMCRSILSAIRLDVTSLSIRLVYDYDIDYKTNNLFFDEGIIGKDLDD